MKKKVLIIEDDITFSSVLKKNLISWNYSPKVINDGNLGLNEAFKSLYDLILIDIVLPGITGLEILKKIKHKELSVPIIIITQSHTSTNQIATFRNGANLFHSKPIDYTLLKAQIDSLIKDTYTEKPININGFTIEFAKRLLTYKKKSLNLTSTEVRLLTALYKNQGYVVDRQNLINATFKGSLEKSYGSIDTLVSRFRKKISKLHSSLDNDSFIETVYGAGYKLK